MREISTGEPEAVLERFDPYEVVALLGQGGMGRVYRARRPRDGSSVAIKAMSADLLGDPEALPRFKREIESARAVDHPNVARILDQGQTEKGIPFLVMEYIDGPSLADLIQNRMELPWSRVANFLFQAAQGLQAAFAHKIIHRDIKPCNLMLGEGDVLKIVDFGLAKNLFENSLKTKAGDVLGTPRYMAPEQVRGKTVDHRSDMYALGATFYHLIAGQPAFEADTPQGVMLKHLQAPLVPLYVINPNVPGDLAELVQRLMAKDPAERFEEYDELIAQARQVEMARLAKEKAQEEREYMGPHSAEANPALASMGSDPIDLRSDQPQADVIPAARILQVQEGDPPRKSRGIAGPISLVLGFVVILAFATLLMRQYPDRQGRERSGWSVLVGRLLSAEPEGSALQSERQQLETLRDNVARMNIVRAASAEYQLRHQRYPRSVDDLLAEDILKTEDVFDVWGRKFEIYPVRQAVVSFGEDGRENSSDDFEMNSRGTLERQPRLYQEFAFAEQ